jgi:REP element-mobilizing transposase RayT
VKNTYTQLRYHLVFSTKNRMPFITGELRGALYDYMGGVLRGHGGTLLASGGMPDHVHLLAGWGTTVSVAEMLKLVKGSSSHWLNDRPDAPPGFAWQEGYGAFTVSASQVPAVKRYILNQEAHHRKVSFLEEFRTLLEKHGVDFDPKTFAD